MSLVYENKLDARLPFAHLNLCRNPFGEITREEQAALAQVQLEAVLLELLDTNVVVQFVGEKGYGKTTHLLAIQAAVSGATYTHIPEGQTATIIAGRPTLIDEAQRMTWWQRWYFFRRPAPLVLGTHFDYQRSLERLGRRVITVQVGQETSVQHIHHILNQRIEWVRRQSGPVPQIRLETVQRLMQQFGPDIRSIQQALYEQFQSLQEICHV
ncbi:MAG: hypothetical protein KDA87_03410 [Planctomycetales bacterium]|nr:hypothetical protein [Planctomycetales bacterium]